MTLLASRLTVARDADGLQATSRRDFWFKIFLVTSIALATLWDFRIYDFRLFDGMALIIFGAYIVVTWVFRDLSLLTCRNYFPLLTVVIAYAGLGFILHHHRSSLAIIFLCTVSFLVTAGRDWKWLKTPIKYLIIAHAAIFAAQLLTFHLTGAAIDPHAFLGTGSRILQNGVDIRAAGLFQEANSYCANLFLLTSVAILLRAGRPVVVFAALTMMASNSIWGFAAAGILVAQNEFRDGINSHRLFAYGASIVLLIGLFNVFLWLAKPADYPVPMFYWRISEIAHDPSLWARYVGKACDVESAYGPGGRLLSLALGEGLTTKYFTLCLPANGIAFLSKSFGILGALALFVSVAFAIRGLNAADQVIIAISFVFTFTTYPLATYFIFWIWLWMMLAIARGAVVSQAASLVSGSIAANGVP